MPTVDGGVDLDVFGGWTDIWRYAEVATGVASSGTWKAVNRYVDEMLSACPQVGYWTLVLCIAIGAAGNAQRLVKLSTTSAREA